MPLLSENSLMFDSIECHWNLFHVKTDRAFLLRGGLLRIRAGVMLRLRRFFLGCLRPMISPTEPHY